MYDFKVFLESLTNDNNKAVLDIVKKGYMTCYEDAETIEDESPVQEEPVVENTEMLQPNVVESSEVKEENPIVEAEVSNIKKHTDSEKIGIYTVTVETTSNIVATTEESESYQIFEILTTVDKEIDAVISNLLSETKTLEQPIMVNDVTIYETIQKDFLQPYVLKINNILKSTDEAIVAAYLE